jgi:hypothetical protein
LSELEQFKRHLEMNKVEYNVRAATANEGRHGASFVLEPERPSQVDDHITFEVYVFDVFGRYLGKIINDYFVPGKYSEVVAGRAS